MSLHPISNQYLVPLLNGAQLQGINIDQMLEQHQLQLSTPAKIPRYQLAKLLTDLSETLNDELFGLSKLKIPKGSAQYLVRLMAGSDDLEAALNLGSEFTKFLDTRLSFKLSVSHGIATYEVDTGDASHNPLLSSMLLLCLHRICGWLISEQVVLHDVVFDHAPPSFEDDFQFIFPCPRHYNQQRLAIRFSARYLNLKINKDKDEIERFQAQYPLDVLTNQVNDQSYSGQIRKQLQNCPNCRFPSLDVMAESMGTTPKVLRHRLKGEGTSYQNIKDLLRKDKSIHLLSKRDHNIAQIAKLVGFTEAGAFTRAFKGWTGSTPGNYQNH